MYTKTAMWVTLAFFVCVVTVALSHAAGGGAGTGAAAGSVPIHPDAMRLLARLDGTTSLVRAGLVLWRNVVPVGVSLALTGLVAGCPGRLRLLRYFGFGVGLGFALFFFAFNALVLGQLLALRAVQSADLGSWLVLGVLPHGIPEILAFGLMIGSPWLVPVWRCRSHGLWALGNATDGEVRASVAPALSLLLIAAAIEAFVTPVLMHPLIGT